MRRLTAEEVRDSILAVERPAEPRSCAAPSVYPKISAEVLAGISFPDKDGALAATTPTSRAEPPQRVRPREAVAPGADPGQRTTRPTPTTVARCGTRRRCRRRRWACSTASSPTSRRRLLAKRLAKDARRTTWRSRCARGIRLTTGRVPTADEVAKDVAFIAELKAKHKLDDATALHAVRPAAAERERVRVPGLTRRDCHAGAH